MNEEDSAFTGLFLSGKSRDLFKKMMHVYSSISPYVIWIEVSVISFCTAYYHTVCLHPGDGSMVASDKSPFHYHCSSTGGMSGRSAGASKCTVPVFRQSAGDFKTRRRNIWNNLSKPGESSAGFFQKTVVKLIISCYCQGNTCITRGGNGRIWI